jgi:uncharacterized protein
MPYIDSNVFIYPIIYDVAQEPKVKRANEILHSIARGELQAFTSTLTWDEVVWVVRKTMGREEAVSQGKKLLGFSNLQWITADENVLSQAQGLLAKYNLRPRDCIHVASAVSKQIKLIISDDEDIDLVKEVKREPLL